MGVAHLSAEETSPTTDSIMAIAGVWRKDKCYVLSIHFESFAENRIC